MIRAYTYSSELCCLCWASQWRILLRAGVIQTRPKLSDFLDFDRMLTHTSMGCSHDSSKRFQLIHRLPILLWIFRRCDRRSWPSDLERPVLPPPKRSSFHSVPLVPKLRKCGGTDSVCICLIKQIMDLGILVDSWTSRIHHYALFPVHA